MRVLSGFHSADCSRRSTASMGASLGTLIACLVISVLSASVQPCPNRSGQQARTDGAPASALVERVGGCLPPTPPEGYL